MAAPAGIDELRHRYAAQPRRYLAPLANALRRQGALEEAVTMLRAQLAEYPDHLTGHVVLGQALFDTGALAESREAFERARALDPGNRVVLQHLGEIASLAGDAGGARLWFGRLRAADPYADDVAAQLGGAGEPPAAYDVDEDDAPVAVDAGHEVAEPAAEGAGSHSDLTQGTASSVVDEGAVPAPAAVDLDALDAPAAESFELLEFDPAPHFTPAPALDPVIGLDLPPQTPPPELRAEGGEDAAESLDHVAAGPFATETMAGLLAAQGHTEQAVALYERLAAERPGDEALRERLAALRGATPAAPEVAPDPAPEPAPPDAPGEAHSDALVGARPTARHPAGEAAGADASLGALLAAAFADVPRRRDVPAAAHAQLVPSATTPGTADEADPFADVSFDHFFPEPSATAAPDAHAPTPPASDPADDADLARFDAWLRQTAA